MASFSNHIQEIKSLISLNVKSHKSFAYSTLLQLQEQCSSDTCSIQTLAQESQALLSQIIMDIADDDEEMLVSIKAFVFLIVLSCARTDWLQLKPRKRKERTHYELRGFVCSHLDEKFRFSAMLCFPSLSEQLNRALTLVLFGR